MKPEGLGVFRSAQEILKKEKLGLSNKHVEVSDTGFWFQVKPKTSALSN